MDVKEISAEIENVDRNVEKNTDSKYVWGLVARGVWQIALQLAIGNRRELDDNRRLRS